MALRDLLVYLDQTSRSPARLQLVADLARRNGSRITALYVREWSPAQLAHRRTAELAGRPFADVEALDCAAEDSIDQSALEARAALERLAVQYGLETEWRMVRGEARIVLPQHARYADLCILDTQMPAMSSSSGDNRLSEEILFTAGRPVLLMPQTGDFSTLGAHVAVAWNSSRAAARALNDALPLLEHSQQTTVITVNARDFVERPGALPLPKLLAHLQRHGISARSIELPDVSPAEIADTLQEQARAAGADILVAGAHGHTWLHEVLLGSVTRDLLSRLRLPVMMSH
ncbi:MAG TPA: universal stress protein [Steroidobacteraceae bacterium]|jgi:nucleotide-binding universal stress UspA family protein|nr:universal stress protein [Steroidobacteraceae bacterium]